MIFFWVLFGECNPTGKENMKTLPGWSHLAETAPLKAPPDKLCASPVSEFQVLSNCCHYFYQAWDKSLSVTVFYLTDLNFYLLDDLYITVISTDFTLWLK